MKHADKIKNLDALAELLSNLRGGAAGRQPIVHCHGVFDLLHIGHIRYLQKARSLGATLIVTVTPDRYVNKGPHRPAFQEKLRVDALAALDCVDYVAINRWPTASEAIRLLRPDVYAKGAEFRDRKTPELLEEEQAAVDVGARVEYVDEVTSSSSRLINEYLSPFADETERYLRDFRARHSAADVIGWLDRARPLKALVIGETIIDEYYSCSAVGQSAKAPILATRYESHERFAGGALAVANHVASFCQDVTLVSMLGSEHSDDDWVRGQLNDRVSPRFIHKANSPTITKRRYRESYFGIPLFAIDFLSDEPLTNGDETRLCDLLEEIGQHDLVIVSDYGHQMLSERVVGLLVDQARFLAVNTQANADNTGFHTISKYPRADFVSLAERELRLECRSPSGDLSRMLMDVGQRLYANTIVVTLGKRGCLGYNRRAGHDQAPSLATRVIDRVGAGDAFFAITSLCAALDAPLDILAFLGNVAGAEAVAVLGHARSIEREPLERHIDSLFK